MSDEKFARLVSHPCGEGLSQEALHEIADAATLVEVKTGEYLHRADERVTSLYLVVQGRLKTSFLDVHGEELIQRFLTRGHQFGALGGAQTEPVPINVIATEPSILLRLDYKTVLTLGGKYPTFQVNLVRIVGKTAEPECGMG